MNKLLLALLSASMTSAAICNESSCAKAPADTAVEADKEKVVAEAVVAKRCSGCPCTTPTADKSATVKCPCEEAGNVCACPQTAEAAVVETPADTQDVKS